jgi:beta-lactamase regulating signal transducer with metallopeptidase domain
MTDLLSLPITQSLGLSLLHFLWQGSIVGIVLFVLLCTLHKPQQRYLVSCLALIALTVLPVATFASIYEKPQQPKLPLQTNEVAPTPEVVTKETAPTPVITPQQPSESFLNKTRLTLYLPWLVLTWFTGALIFSAKLLLSFLALQRFRSKGVRLAEPTLQLKLLEFSQRLNVRQHITLLESKLVPVPVVLGWLRPVILIPTSAITGLAPKQLEMLLAHELAHIMRRDYLVNVLQSVVEALLFYHPVVWWVSKQIRREREYCCDDIAVSLTGNRQHYAQTLLSLAEMRVQLAPSANGGELFTRISRLLQPLETDMKPSYFLAGLSSLGVLFALLLTVVNVSVAQEDKAQLWVTVVGDVTFSDDYSEISDIAHDAYVVVEERNGLESRKVVVKVIKSEGEEIKFISAEASEIITDSNGTKIINGRIVINGNTTFIDDTIVVKIEENLLIATGYNYTVNGTKQKFNDDAEAWYEQAFKDSIQAIYLKTPEAARDDSISSEHETEKYKVYLFADRSDMFNSHSFNAAAMAWKEQPSSQDLLDAYRDDLRQQLQLYSAGILSDRGYAGYLDGVTSDNNFPVELFPVALENATEISDKVLREQLITLIEKHQIEPKEPTLIYTSTIAAEESPTKVEAAPSPDGKNRISGKVISEGNPVPHTQVSLSIPLDAEVDPGLIVANTASNKDGEFSFRGFPIPSGEYVLYIDGEGFFQGTDPTIEINSQELVVILDVQRTFDIVEPTLNAIVSTTPNFSWKGIADADRYLVFVWEMSNQEQVVYQMVDTTNFTLDLPLAPDREYNWTIAAFDKYGKMVNAAYGDVFKTE